MLKVTAWYCNDCGGTFLSSGEEPVTCTCEPGAKRFNYSVGNGTYTPPNDGMVRSVQMIGGGGGGSGHGGYPDYPRTDVLKNGDLDIRATEWGISRNWGETDEELRNRIKNGMLNHQKPIGDPHAGHEVIENYAGGKAFKYCRKCKVEV